MEKTAIAVEGRGEILARFTDGSFIQRGYGRVDFALIRPATPTRWFPTYIDAANFARREGISLKEEVPAMLAALAIELKAATREAIAAQDRVTRLKLAIAREANATQAGPATLTAFAGDVLEILQHSKEWNADTLNDIAFKAQLRGLAIDDEAGNFKRA